MRILAILIVASLSASAARAETLSAADREALLESLDKLRDAASTKVDARFRIAMAAYHEAMVSEAATVVLYMKCIEKVNFVDQQRKISEYLDWKHKDDVKAQHADPAFRLALHYQLRWLALTLQASSEKANLTLLATDAQDIVDAIFRDADKLAGQEKILQASVTSTEFAKAYEIGDLKKDKWPLSAINLEEVYGTIVLPPLRIPTRVTALRAAWIKRIQQEGVKTEAWAGHTKAPPKGKNERGKGDKGKSEHRVGMAADLKNPEYDRFVLEQQPELQWQMEVDLFRNGDESAAALRMLAHLEKHITHKSARKWGEEFSALLKPQPAATPIAAAAPAVATPAP